ncbi:MAG: ABC transporter permease, partial [Planctomycetota bacterium]
MNDLRTTASISADADTESEGQFDHWKQRFQWVDDRLSFVSDYLNPILVKETRQALKSRQFVISFSMLLLCAFAWTLIGTVTFADQIQYSAVARQMLTGYFLVLAVPMLLIVPLFANRSLASELDDGTLELLSISTLTPRQIVLGKLASAIMQMALYFVALSPCVAFAYTLRGISLPSIVIILLLLIVSGVTLTIFALFLAPIGSGRFGQVLINLGLLSVLVAATGGVGSLVYGFLYENATPPDQYWPQIIGLSLGISFSICLFLLAATESQLLPKSENASTPVRWALLWATAIVVGVVVFATGTENVEVIMVSFIIGLPILAGLWMVAGSMLCAESSELTPRMRRRLPVNLVSRSLFS